MTDDLEKLAALLRDETPAPSDAAKRAAITAGMAAFEKNAENIQGSADAARPTNNRPKPERGFLEGLKDMFDRLTGRQMMLGTASFATIALAVVITQSYDFNSGPGPVLDLGTQASIDGTLVADSDEAPVLQSTKDVASSDDRSQANAPVEMAQQSPVSEPAPEYEDTVVDRVEAPRERDMAVAEEAEVMTEGFASGLAVQAPSTMLVAPPVPAGQAVVGRMIADSEAPYIEPITENRDQFTSEDINPLKVTFDNPVSTFSIDVDTASYAFMRSSLMGGYLPNPDAVRTEELINYFSYDYPVPDVDGTPFSSSVTVTDTPWNPDTQLMHIAIQGYELMASERPPVNLVFLIDTSGSMNNPDKLPLLIQSFRLLLGELNEHDSVAIVTYAGSAGMALEPTPATETHKILNSLLRLSAGGSTAGQAGLQQAYALAEEMSDDGDTSRVILATDGDFNVGISDRDQLQAYIEEKRDTGVYLSILGFGHGNYNDALMQTLAQNGNGTASYIDTLAEAQKVLVDQIGGALFTIAQDVKIQVEFNPAEIAEYRLIGYETRALAREDFNNDAVDAGEIGAGHSVTALYEITPVGSPAISNDPLRYGDAAPLPEGNGELAFLKLRYKNPGESTSTLITTPVMAGSDAGLGTEVDFAAAVAGFGQLLRGDTRLGDWSYDDVVALAQSAKGDDPFGYRAEFIRLVRLAETAQ